ncbi:flavodoxin family protein [Christiangramia fulva]|nr:flavodoxin [Christiangramia fulva]
MSKSGNILIIYLTRTNNTKAVAEIIQDKVGGRLVALEKENPYPENYQQIVAQVDRENEEGYLPPLKTKIENLEAYDTVFVGFPTWDMQMPPPMKSFLTENDLSGKTVIPFNTNAGYGVGQGFEQLKRLCPNSKILEGFSVEGGYEKRGVFLAIKGDREEKVAKKVENWLRDIGVL